MEQKILEDRYQEFITHLNANLPDGIINIDLQVLQSLHLLDHLSSSEHSTDSVTSYFQMIETSEKITLYNDHFAVWIVPEVTNNVPTTYSFIAKINNDFITKLENAFVTSGIYNSSYLVLRILEKILIEINENEELIGTMNKLLQSPDN